jgi:predicted dehydrogenase
VRVLLVGYGSAGQGIHLPLLRAAGASPSVVVTASPQRVAQVHAELPDALVVPDLDAALGLPADQAPQLAVLASPSGVHASNALACIAAGVPAVVDKPLTVDAESAAAVVAAAAHAGVPLTVFQNRRWDAENLTLARLLTDGELGQVYRFERRWERWRPVPKNRWRENAPASEGGGILLDLGSHLVDSAVHLFGPVASVFAQTAAWTTTAEDDVFLALQHVGGMRSHLGATSLAGAPGPRTRVLGSRAAYVVTQFPGEQHVFGFDDAPGCTGWLVADDERTAVPSAPGGHEDFYPAVLAALALPDAAARQAAMPVDPRDAVHVLAVLDAARLSAAQNRVVPVVRDVPRESGVTPRVGLTGSM